MANNGNQAPGQEGGATAAQWVVGCLSTVLVLLGIGFLLWEASKGTARPPIVAVAAVEVNDHPNGGYLVQIVAANSGGTSARSLVVEGRLLAPDDGPGGAREIEKATTTLSWVPAHAERKGGLFFRHDPTRYRLELSPKGYDQP